MINYENCTDIAERVVAMYHAKELELITVGHSQLKKWMSESAHWVLQIRLNMINGEVVSQILEKISVYGHIKHADPILAIRANLNGKDGLYLVNGNNTCCALEQVLRLEQFRSLNITEVSVAIIPNDMLPTDKENFDETLKLIATMMNRQPKVTQSMKKEDIYRIVENDLVKGVDVTDMSYKIARANSADMTYRTINDIVAKVRANARVKLTNKLNHFKPLVEADWIHIENARKKSDNFVQIAAFSKQKLFSSFAGAFQHVSQRKHCKSVHIIFHFTKFEDIENHKDWAIEQLEKCKKLVKFDVTYEFLDEMQIVPDDGIQVTLANEG